MSGEVVVVRGGGDLATGVVQKLWRAGMRVVVLEVAEPTAIRRSVALSTAVREGSMRVEDVTARLVGESGVEQAWQAGVVPLLIDPEGAAIPRLGPLAVVDAIIAKRNLGTHRGMAPITIALGPGFAAPRDVTAVIETMRGHDLGRLIEEGSALADTGTPGLVGGRTDRVLHAPCDGEVRHVRAIGDVVQQGEALFYVGEEAVCAPFDGLLRGLIVEGYAARKGLKVADIDPRVSEQRNCFTISDKARCLGGAVLEAILYFKRALTG